MFKVWSNQTLPYHMNSVHFDGIHKMKMLKYHTEANHCEAKFPCTICGKHFNTSQNMNSHRNNVKDFKEKINIGNDGIFFDKNFPETNYDHSLVFNLPLYLNFAGIN